MATPSGISPEKTRSAAIEALTEALADPGPRVQFGTKAQAGFVTGNSAKTRPAAQFLVDRGWIERTGGSVGDGKARKALFRMTPAGLQVALTEGDTAVALHRMALAAEASRDQLAALAAVLGRQTAVLTALQERLMPPDVQAALSWGSEQRAWLEHAVTFVRDNPQRHPLNRCPLPALYRAVGAPRGLTIGAFHDGLRTLVQDGMLRLEPYIGPRSQLEEDHYALMSGQEIKYYAVIVDA